MKAYIITTTIIDHDEVGADEVKVVIESTRYPNRCISPRVESIETVDIGSWEDDHPLNKRGTDALAWLRAAKEQA